MIKYNGGVQLVDCKGLNLLAQSTQTITGIYDVLEKCYASNKVIVAVNCEYGTGVKLTPIPVFAIKENDVFICTASILQIRVAKNNTITITSLLS